MAGFYEQRDRDGNLIGWQAKVRKKGYPTQTKVFRSKREAQEWAAIVESEMARGVWKDRGEAESTSLREALARYAQEITTGKKEQKSEIARIRQWQERPIASRSLASIRGKDVAAVIRDMEAEGKSPNTIRLHLAVLSHLFKVARTEWGMEGLSNPVELVRKPKLPQGRERRLVDDEEARLLEACHKVNPELAAIVQIAIETGMRQGEILGMTWNNVSVTKRQVFLPDTKNGTSRTVPLSLKAATILGGLPRKDAGGPVFSYTADGMRASWAKALKRAGIEGLTFHDLRHEATSRLFEKGLNPMQVAAITGHKTLQMLKRYTHLRAEDLVKLLD
ncbi:site-specific integrase [Acidithiobacillus caldus]|uniref:site-specific integrase n=2 Tax=Acidithiobacillaceae TaxID=225058 RepID=UPI001C073F83|nr:site-specific integrase [Acidithiobacillus caldus]MBU2762884.1 site-specific integrase [Acidithiobacillus caldus]